MFSPLFEKQNLTVLLQMCDLFDTNENAWKFPHLSCTLFASVSGMSSVESLLNISWTYSAVPLQRGQFSPKSPQNSSHTSPVRARCRMYFMGSICDLYSASVTAVLYAISCWIGSCYNGTRWIKLMRLYIWNTTITEYDIDQTLNLEKTTNKNWSC